MESPTTLTFDFACRAEDAAGDFYVYTTEPVKTDDGMTGRRRVLIVDDNHDSAELTATLVEMAGGESRTANGGNDAIALANQFKPDAILLDIGLPDISGYDVCRTIRQQSWASSIPIIALTGRSGPEATDQSRTAGFDAHLVKPVDPSELLDLLTTLK